MVIRSMAKPKATSCFPLHLTIIIPMKPSTLMVDAISISPKVELRNQAPLTV